LPPNSREERDAPECCSCKLRLCLRAKGILRIPTANQSFLKVETKLGKNAIGVNQINNI